MAAKFDDIMTQLRNRQFAPVYLLMGTEPFFIDVISKYIENNVMDEADRDFNQQVFYGKDSRPDEVIASAKQFPFGSDYRVVILKEAKDLPNFEHLIPYFQQPQSSTIFVVCYKYGTIRATQLKNCDKAMVTFTSEAVKDYQVAAWAQSQAAKHHFKLNNQAANIISEHIGNDLSRIDNEFEKLKIFLPEGAEITPEIVEKHVGISKEYNIFELQNALGERNVNKTLAICINFVQHVKENPIVKTVAMLFPFFNKLLAYKLLVDKSKENVAKIFGSNAFIADKNAAYAMKYSVAQLQKIISLLREYDVKAKGVDNDAPDEELLKEMIYRILHQ